MQFVYSGSLDQFKAAIQAKAQELNKDILVEQDGPGTLNIGFLRLGHSSGRFFAAAITEENGELILTGKMKDIDTTAPRNFVQKLWAALSGYLALYLIFELAPMAVWLWVFGFSHLWVPLLLPIPVIVLLRIINIWQEKKADAAFIAFMSTFADMKE